MPTGKATHPFVFVPCCSCRPPPLRVPANSAAGAPSETDFHIRSHRGNASPEPLSLRDKLSEVREFALDVCLESTNVTVNDPCEIGMPFASQFFELPNLVFNKNLDHLVRIEKAQHIHLRLLPP